VFVKLLLDETLSPAAAVALAADGIDACHVRDRGILGASDHDVLERAYQEDRVLVTSNVDDFVKLAAAREIMARVTKRTRTATTRKWKPVEDISTIPRVDDFRLLGDLDEFNKHVKAAIGHLLERGYHRLFVKWMVKQHLSYAGAQVLAEHATLVDLVTMNVDKRTEGSKRRELLDALVQAGALAGDGGSEKQHKRLRDRLSNARKWRRQRDELLRGWI
jgi:predicted nuclease of predicted toxin-antitoxin system